MPVTVPAFCSYILFFLSRGKFLKVPHGSEYPEELEMERARPGAHRSPEVSWRRNRTGSGDGRGREEGEDEGGGTRQAEKKKSNRNIRSS